MNQVILNTGASMPLLGFGTYQVKDPAVCQQAVETALQTGYRLIDTAQFYQNEEAVGHAIRASGIKREELFITTKLWIHDATYDKAGPAFAASLKRLGLDYVDLYLLHHPYHDVFGAWRALTGFYQEGRARAIGVSNFYADRLTDLALYAEVKPAVDQLECHPYHQRREMTDSLQEYGVVLQAWGPFSQGKTDLLTNPVMESIAKKHGKTTAQISLRWLIQRGISALPKSVKPERIRENFDIFDFALAEEDMAAIGAMDTRKPTGLPHTDPVNVKRIFHL